MIFWFFLYFLFLSLFLYVLFSRRFLQFCLPVVLWSSLLQLLYFFYFPELFLILRIFLFITSCSCLMGVIFLSLSFSPRTFFFYLFFWSFILFPVLPSPSLWIGRLGVVFWGPVRKGAGEPYLPECKDVALDSISLFAVWRIDPSHPQLYLVSRVSLF